MSQWQTLFALQAGAAATLTGLVFVAVSLNLSSILTVAGLSGRAAESLLQFLQVFFVASVGLVPGQPAHLLGWEILAIAGISWSAQVSGQLKYVRIRAGHRLSWLVRRVLLSQLATIPFLIAGFRLLAGLPDAIYWLVPGFIFSFVAGITSSWVLLIEILR